MLKRPSSCKICAYNIADHKPSSQLKLTVACVSVKKNPSSLRDYFLSDLITSSDAANPAS